MLQVQQLLVLLVEPVDISPSLVHDETDSILHDSSKQELTSDSVLLLQPILSMLLEQDHLIDSNSLPEHPITISSLLMHQVMHDGQVMLQQPLTSTLPESLLCHQVEDTSQNSWSMDLV